MTGFCSACGAQRADGAGFCGQCGHRFEAEVPVVAASGQAPPPLPPQAQPASAGAPPPAAASAARPKRPLPIGQKLILGLFLIGFLLASWVVIEAKNRARHPWHHYR